MVKFDVHNRYTGAVQFTAEIECIEDTSRSIKLGLAVRWAVKNGADLAGADLEGADLKGADLKGADLEGANLRRAVLRRTNLEGADLRRTVLHSAILFGADLFGAILVDADLRRANLFGADLRRTDLRRTDLEGANLEGANLEGADLGGLKIIQGPIREDGFQYILHTSALGGCVIVAGCQTWVGADAFEQAREHCRTKTSARYREQALRIVDYLEGELKAIRAQGAFL